MPSLEERLKSLGVKTGGRDLPAPAPRQAAPLDQALGGQPLQTPQGETYIVEQRLPLDAPYGSAGLRLVNSLRVLGKWAKDERIQDLPPQAFAFLDTETTGLSGGTGTYAFLIGAGRFEAEPEECFHLVQFFMRSPVEETAQLIALEQFLAPCQAIVSFNGKSFDVPLLQTRFMTHGWQSPFGELAHIDLLHLARRLWRERLPSRTLGNLEVQILEAARTEEDVPGWMIPEMYFDYLRDGDPEPLKGVMYHNAMDVISLAALLNHMGGLLDEPLQGGRHHSVDLIALAKLFEDLGELETATRLYIHGLEAEQEVPHEDAHNQRLPVHVLLDAIKRLALIHKRQQNYPAAVALWEQAAHHQHLPACIELAKYHEHQCKDYEEATRWTQNAVELVQQAKVTPFERCRWLEELNHRQERLSRYAASRAPQTPQA
ncbi:MAG: ribonuclease H-like domain-containing protein [Chloroflexota bacterium]